MQHQKDADMKRLLRLHEATRGFLVMVVNAVVSATKVKVSSAGEAGDGLQKQSRLLNGNSDSICVD